jgi:hypothetical protein
VSPAERPPVVFRVDVDNTRLDNDRVTAALRGSLDRRVATERRARYRAHLIDVHNQRELDEVEQRYPADHYVLVDDKLRIVAIVSTNPAADLTVEHSGDLVDYDLSTLRGRADAGVAAEPGQRR